MVNKSLFINGMPSTTFDTLQASKDLQNHGFDQEQAEAIAQVVRNGQNELATKSDIALVKSDIALVKSDIALVKSDIALVRSDIENVKWTLGAMIGMNFIVMIGGFSLLATFINQ